MACRDQNRFDNALITINQNAKKANMKLIYSTSSPRTDTVSKKLLNSFDLVLSGILPYAKWLYDYYSISQKQLDSLSNREFIVIERK